VASRPACGRPCASLTPSSIEFVLSKAGESLALTCHDRPACSREALISRAKARPALYELSVSTPPNVVTAAAIMMALAPATTPKNATRQSKTIRPDTSLRRLAALVKALDLTLGIMAP
jgi:hypothetical protein